MPFVNIKITDENVSAEDKQKIIKGVTDLLVSVLDKNPKTTVVVIEEIPQENWGINGQSVKELRQWKT
jgi:4-oxalocrotonate tautomerase